MTPPPDTSGALQPPTPPTGEEIHLPGPTLVPIVNAFGITLAIVGVLVSWCVTAVGVVIFVWSAVRWIRDTRRDIAERPLEHH